MANPFAAALGLPTCQHALLELVSVAAACLHGSLTAFAPRLRRTVTTLAGVLQTIPSLALLRCRRSWPTSRLRWG